MRGLRCCIALALATLGAQAVRAGDDRPDADSADVAGLTTARLEASSADAPRFDRIDMPIAAQPGGPGLRGEVAELGYGWRLSPGGRAEFGVGLGRVAYVARPAGTGAWPGEGNASLLLAPGTMVVVGLRVRASDSTSFYAGAADVRGLGLAGNDRVIGKVGIVFKSAQSRWDVAYGGVGLRLADGSGVTLRARKGGLAIVVRSSF